MYSGKCVYLYRHVTQRLQKKTQGANIYSLLNTDIVLTTLFFIYWPKRHPTCVDRTRHTKQDFRTLVGQDQALSPLSGESLQQCVSWNIWHINYCITAWWFPRKYTVQKETANQSRWTNRYITYCAKKLWRGNHTMSIDITSGDCFGPKWLAYLGWVQVEHFMQKAGKTIKILLLFWEIRPLLIIFNQKTF